MNAITSLKIPFTFISYGYRNKLFRAFLHLNNVMMFYLNLLQAYSDT